VPAVMQGVRHLCGSPVPRRTVVGCGLWVVGAAIGGSPWRGHLHTDTRRSRTVSSSPRIPRSNAQASTAARVPVHFTAICAAECTRLTAGPSTCAFLRARHSLNAEGPWISPTT
jgi:hypothetical protein